MLMCSFVFLNLVMKYRTVISTKFEILTLLLNFTDLTIVVYSDQRLSRHLCLMMRDNKGDSISGFHKCCIE
jgi:hypothetical protein